MLFIEGGLVIEKSSDHLKAASLRNEVNAHASHQDRSYGGKSLRWEEDDLRLDRVEFEVPVELQVEIPPDCRAQESKFVR